MRDFISLIVLLAHGFVLFTSSHPPTHLPINASLLLHHHAQSSRRIFAITHPLLCRKSSEQRSAHSLRRKVLPNDHQAAKFATTPQTIIQHLAPCSYHQRSIARPAYNQCAQPTHPQKTCCHHLHAPSNPPLHPSSTPVAPSNRS